VRAGGGCLQDDCRLFFPPASAMRIMSLKERLSGIEWGSYTDHTEDTDFSLMFFRAFREIRVPNWVYPTKPQRTERER
jgi:hypothetical protein